MHGPKPYKCIGLGHRLSEGQGIGPGPACRRMSSTTRPCPPQRPQAMAQRPQDIPRPAHVPHGSKPLEVGQGVRHQFGGSRRPMATRMFACTRREKLPGCSRNSRNMLVRAAAPRTLVEPPRCRPPLVQLVPLELGHVDDGQRMV